MPQIDDIQLRRFYGEIGGRIRAAREAAKFTQDALGAKVGLTRSSVANIEAGRQRFPLDTLVLIAEHLRTSPIKLIEDSSILHDDTDYSGVRERLEEVTGNNREFVEGALAGLLDSEEQDER